MDDEGGGDAVCEGEGEPKRDGLGDFDDSGEDEVEREGAGEVATMCGGLVWTGVGTWAGD